MKERRDINLKEIEKFEKDITNIKEPMNYRVYISDELEKLMASLIEKN